MKAGTKKLLERAPLLEGEEIVAELDGRRLDEHGNEVGKVTLALTSWRIGLWQRKDAPGWIRLTALRFVYTGEDRLHLVFSDGGFFTTASADEKDLSAFTGAIFYLRRRVLLDAIQPQFREVATALKNGQFDRALSALEAVTEAELFHPGPGLLRYILLRAQGRGAEAADALADLTFRGLVTLPLQTAHLVTSAALNPAQAYRVAVGAAVGIPYTEQSPWQLIVSAHDASRRGRFDDAASALEQLGTHLAGAPQAFILLVYELSGLLVRSHWLRLAAMLDDVAPQWAYQSQEDGGALDAPALTRAWRRALDATLDATSRVEALVDCVKRVGGVLEDCTEKLRVLCCWEELARERDGGIPPDEDWEAACLDIEVFESVLSACKAMFDGEAEVRSLWAKLRLGRARADRSTVDRALFLHRVLLNGYAAGSPEVWVSALAAAELLLKAGRGREAAQLVEGAYEAIRADISISPDPYHEQARTLASLYVALARRDAPRVQLFAELLGADGVFSWVRGLVVEHFPEALRAGAPAGGELAGAVLELQRWLKARRSSFTDPRIDASALKIEAAQRRETLTVVVGGETSAGKSSFINRLLGADLLFATQEEATAVPTHVRWGPRWTLTVHGEGDRIRDQLDVPPEGPGRERAVQQFIERYTFLSSRESAGTRRVIIEAPLSTVPRGLEIVDTPGLNAHAARTALAQEAIDDAHVCIFVIDARNALKAGEMKKIQWAASAVGKTLFVLNKMDLVLGDDDLDCDVNAPADVLARVRKDLTAALGTETVNVHAVSSAPPQNVPAAARPYVEALQEVRSRLGELLVQSRERLVAYSAAKAARVASSAAVGNALQQVAAHEVEVSRLLRQVPGDPSLFRGEVLGMVQSTWDNAASAYTGAMTAALEAAWEEADGKIARGLQACSDHDDVKRFVERKLPAIFREYLQAIDASRSEQWDQVGRAVLDDVAGLFRFLYEGLPFEARFDASRLLSVATPLPLGKSKALQGTVAGMLDDANFKEMGGMAAGAALGTLFLPGIGTVIGGVLGSIFGNSLNDDLLQRIYTAVIERLRELGNGAIQALNADITATESAPSPMMAGILANVEAERARFEKLVTTRVTETRRQLKAAEERAESYRSVALEASEWARRFEAMMAVRA